MDALDPIDPSTLPPLPPPAPQPEPAAPPWWRRRVAVVGAAVVVAAAVAVVLIVVLTSGGSTRRGAPSAQAAASRFVAAIDAGDRDGATGLSCDAFTTQAEQFARTGADAGIKFTLESVAGSRTSGSARATLVETLRVGSASQRERIALALMHGDGGWLVCGRRQLG